MVGGGQSQPIPEQRAPQAVSEQHCHGDVILSLWARLYRTKHADYKSVVMMKLMKMLRFSFWSAPNTLGDRNSSDFMFEDHLMITQITGNIEGIIIHKLCFKYWYILIKPAKTKICLSCEREASRLRLQRNPSAVSLKLKTKHSKGWRLDWMRRQTWQFGPVDA